MEFSMV